MTKNQWHNEQGMLNDPRTKSRAMSGGRKASGWVSSLAR